MMASAAAAIPVTVMAADPAVYGGTPISEHVGGYDYPFSQRKLVTYAYDFSLERINFYASDPAIALGRTSGEIVDGALTTKEGKDCIFGSAVCLGDQYGLEEGYLSFDLNLTGGTVYLGVRTSRTAADNTKRGVWFTFDGSDSMRIHEPECGLEATVPMPVSLNEKKTFTLHDGLDTLTLSVGETVIARVKYTEEGYLAFCDGVPAGFTLYCFNFSTFLGRAGIWLEDLFVLPQYRSRGIGLSLMKTLAILLAAMNSGFP